MNREQGSHSALAPPARAPTALGELEPTFFHLLPQRRALSSLKAPMGEVIKRKKVALSPFHNEKGSKRAGE